MQLVDFSSSFWSVVPPLLALSLAIITRRVLLSLSAGIIVGGLMLTHWNPIDGAIYIKNSVLSLVYGDEGLNFDSLNIIIFLLLLGALTALLTVSGSNQAFAAWAQKHIKNRRGAKMLTAGLVFFTFIDDYFHSLAVGAIARPVADKFKISRPKVAYILDSTAAPMCVLMPISSWGAYIMTLVAGLLATHAITDFSPIGAFVSMSLMNYYAIFALITVFIVAWFSFDIGTMARFEREAMNKQSAVEEAVDGQQGRVYALLLPIITLIVVTVGMMIHTGAEALAADGKPFSLLGAFENTTVGISLVVGGSASYIVALLCSFGLVSVSEWLKSILVGFKSMSGAIIILIFAWTINTIVGDMNTGKYLSSLVANGGLNAQFLPALLFVLSVVMAFSTGTSWGTFGIMLPIAASMAANADPSLMLPCMSAVMAGAVCGDHCSPVSDTTILSSTGAACNHIDHVTTQLPYALIVASASFVGFLTLGFSDSALLGFVATALCLALLLLVFKSKQSVKA
ncbi:Na+/H+ antiporter NhaC family protein [Pasteurellaceae bacterium 20609_3]|uniref:Na+/H+ antiporter NhaC family protein n=1 Tax=Spirabiliibacterium mucosae TaxID=28156 RepID=UPI001AAD3503|nr:Na+/H+ antiporter NhaC family protein [Spirabiliibacterium mucosae]MBE2898956.1 Na+/H+ antiporter NhaC family protein [Spirabiliibacterium mucosae]